MLLLVGLGNYGERYAFTRHNVGFIVVDAIASTFRFPEFSKKHTALISVGYVGVQKVMLMKPLTFMNNSGNSVLSAVSMYKIASTSVTVFHDEGALLEGVVKVKKGGGSAGHNGIRSIDRNIGNDYWRVRIGIGPMPKGEDLSRYVLSNFQNIQDIEYLANSISNNLSVLLEGDPSTFVAKVSKPPFAHEETP